MHQLSLILTPLQNNGAAVFTPTVDPSAGMDFNSNVSNVSPAIPLENPIFSTPMGDDDLLSLLALFPSNSLDDHAALPSLPLKFAAHVFEDNGIPNSEWNFQDLPPLMPVTNHPATASVQPISQGKPSSMDIATGLGTSRHQALSNGNFINFPLFARHDVNPKDKRTLAVCNPCASYFALALIYI
jgi:hypothetical protein